MGNQNMARSSLINTL